GFRRSAGGFYRNRKIARAGSDADYGSKGSAGDLEVGVQPTRRETDRGGGGWHGVRSLVRAVARMQRTRVIRDRAINAHRPRISLRSIRATRYRALAPPSERPRHQGGML